MRCPTCQHQNPPSLKFCGECGARLALVCPSCGASNTPAQKFCGECGTKLSTPAAHATLPSPESYTPKHLAERILTSRSALEGERKQVTVLFADLKGSMELLADRDPEEARKLLDPVLERMMEAVHHYEGIVNQVMGDGIMALFGAPLALEDHAVRACYAALRMQDAVKRHAVELQRQGAAPVAIRVGINSGEVVVRSIGSDLHMDYTAVGQTTHLASRVEQLAQPGSTLIAPETLKLVEGYVQLNSLGRVPVKGLIEPLEIFELTGAGTARTRMQVSAARGLTKFVGRAREVETLRMALERAGEGHGQIISVVGEPGVGKSRLFYEFTHSHRVRDWLVLDAASVSYGKATSYLPAIDLLKGYFRIEDRDDARRIQERVTGKLLALDRSLEPLLPAFFALLQVPVDDPRWPGLDPKQRRERTLDAIKRLLLRESQVQPLILVVEDLHWVDGESQAVLDHLVEGLPAARILLLVNFRPEYEHSWGGKTYYAQLRLDALPSESAGELLEAVLGRDPGLGPLKQLLVERTGGNPFFLEESIRTLVEIGALAGEPGARSSTGRIETIQMPATVQTMLAARIDRLPSEEKQLLQAASAVGKDVPYGILQAIVDDSEDILRHNLARLQAAEFLYETRLFPELEYTFKHALTHEVAYGSLLQDRRRELHARVVAAMEHLYSERIAEEAERLAYHALRAGLDEQAAQYLAKAGVKALERSAYREAIEFLQQAMALLDTLPDSARAAEQALNIRMALGPALMATRGNAAPEVEACYKRALELCDRLQDQSRRFPALWALWYVHLARGQHPRAFELAQHALGLAEEGSDPMFLLEGHHAMWSTLIGLGRSAEAAKHCLRGIALSDRSKARTWWLYGTHDPGVCSRNMLGLASWLLGRPDAAVSWIGEALDLSGHLRHDFTTMIVLYVAALVHYQRGEMDEAAEKASATTAFARTHGFTLWPERAAAISAAVLMENRVSDAIVAAQSAVNQLAALGTKSWPEVFNATVLARAYAKAGQLEKGLTVLNSPAAMSGVGFYQPEVQRVRGELLLAQGTVAEAEACFRAAIDLASSRQEKSLELRAAMSLARLLQRGGQQASAQAALAATYAGFTEGFETADLEAARALLAELS